MLSSVDKDFHLCINHRFWLQTILLTNFLQCLTICSIISVQRVIRLLMRETHARHLNSIYHCYEGLSDLSWVYIYRVIQKKCMNTHLNIGNQYLSFKTSIYKVCVCPAENQRNKGNITTFFEMTFDSNQSLGMSLVSVKTYKDLRSNINQSIRF